MNTELGKIEHVSFGRGGYQDAMLGLHVIISGDGWGVGATKSAWYAKMSECSEHAKWTEEDRSKEYDEIMRYVSDLLDAAKVDSVDKLKGVPVEATFEGECLAGRKLESWRVLTEIL